MGEVVAECPHGLTADWCSLCKDKGRAAATKAFRPLPREEFEYHFLQSPWTKAGYANACADCGETIAIDEPIGLRSPGWCCNECAHEYDTKDYLT
jgi:hypothetical protein